MHRHRRKRVGALTAVVIVVLFVLACIACAFAIKRVTSQPAPAAAVQPWCVDPATGAIAYDDDLCERDDDLDGFFDGHVVHPHPKMSKPPKGAPLPSGLKATRTRYVVRTVRPADPPAVVNPKKTVAPAVPRQNTTTRPSTSRRSGFR